MNVEFYFLTQMYGKTTESIATHVVSIINMHAQIHNANPKDLLVNETMLALLKQ